MKTDWDEMAKIAAPVIGPFRYLFGVPKTGFKVAKAFEPYIDLKSERMLICDDVWTDGRRLYNFVNQVCFPPYDWIGFVGFARGPFPKHRIMTFWNYSIEGFQPPQG